MTAHLNVWRFRSIVTRLTTWYAISLFIMLVIATGFLYFSLFKIITTEDNAILRDRVEAISSLIKTSKNPVNALRQRVEFEWATRRFEHVYVKILGSKNSIFIATPDTPNEIENEIFPKLFAIENQKKYSLPTRITGTQDKAY
jgi:hypothetical protein